MSYRFHVFLVFSLLSLLACSRLTNTYNETILNCGALPDAPGHYVQILDPNGEPLPADALTGKVLESGAVVQSLDFTSKGCLRAPDQGFIIIRSQDLKLSRALDAAELQTIPRLILREDRTSKLLPAEPLKDGRHYFGQTFYFVDPGYVLNFYSEDNLKNIEIEYCIDEIKDPENYDYAADSCLQPKYYFIDNLPKIDQGFWSVRYRKQTDQGDGTWSRYLLAVRVTCEGVLRDLDRIAATRCTDIDNLEIKGPGSLEKLKYVSRVSGNLRLEGNDSQSLRGIHNISSVGQLWIIDMKALKSIDFSPRRIKGEIQILLNPVLEDLAGFVSLERVERDLAIFENPVLRSLHGLRQLKSIGGSFLFYANTQIENFEGIDQLESISGDFRLTFMDGLRSFKGLNQLRDIGGTLYVVESDRLTTLDGLQGLRKVAELTLKDNDSLTNLDAIMSLEEATQGIGIVPFEPCGTSNLTLHPEKPVAVYCKNPPANPEPME